MNGTDDTGYLMELAGLAYKEGYLEEELKNVGYNLEVSAFAGGPVINEALASNEIDGATFFDNSYYEKAAEELVQ